MTYERVMSRMLHMNERERERERERETDIKSECESQRGFPDSFSFSLSLVVPFSLTLSLPISPSFLIVESHRPFVTDIYGSFQYTHGSFGMYEELFWYTHRTLWIYK